MLIIGLSGKMGSGKDYIAKQFILKYLKKHHPELNVYFLAFADNLKMQVLDKYNSERSQNISWSDIYPPEHIPKSEYVRKLLQFEGNLMREKDPKYWIKRYDNWIRLFQKNGCDIILTTDVRFQIEKDHLRSNYNGIICKVYAPNRTYNTHNPTLMKDKSEVDLDTTEDESYDYIFQNHMDFNSFESFESIEKHFQPFIDLLENRL